MASWLSGGLVLSSVTKASKPSIRPTTAPVSIRIMPAWVMTKPTCLRCHGQRVKAAQKQVHGQHEQPDVEPRGVVDVVARDGGIELRFHHRGEGDRARNGEDEHHGEIERAEQVDCHPEGRRLAPQLDRGTALRLGDGFGVGCHAEVRPGIVRRECSGTKPKCRSNRGYKAPFPRQNALTTLGRRRTCH